jgi:hypothetical protein
MHSWGAVFRTDAAAPGLLLIGTFSPGGSVVRTDKQVQWETMVLAFQVHATLRSQDLRWWTVVMRKDTTGALAQAALHKGSFASSNLQLMVMNFFVLTGIDTVFLHAHGTDLVRKNIDAVSLERAISLHGSVIKAAMV